MNHEKVRKIDERKINTPCPEEIGTGRAGILNVLPSVTQGIRFSSLHY